MKRYLFILLVSIFLISPVVKAEENIQFPLEGMGIANSSTKNLIKPGFGPAAYVNKQWHLIEDSSVRDYPILNNFIKVKANTTYTFSSSKRVNYYYYEFDNEFNEVANYRAFPSYCFTTSVDCSYILIGAYSSLDNLNTSDSWYQLEEGSEATEYVEYSEKIETDPVIPDTPKPIETNQTQILKNFYSIYIDKLKFISDYCINNYLFLAFIGVILCFIVLELFLKLYNGGGYRKW